MNFVYTLDLIHLFELILDILIVPGSMIFGHFIETDLILYVSSSSGLTISCPDVEHVITRYNSSQRR